MSKNKLLEVNQQPINSLGTTWFSKYDLWRFYAVFDDRTCDNCEMWQTVHDFTGEQVLLWFPYVEIHDQGLMYAHVHPNCRCYFVRVF